MKLPRWLRRWRALRAPQLTADARDGATVQATGTVRALEPLIGSPMTGRPVVLVRTTYEIHRAPPPGATRQAPPFRLERLQVRRFEVDTGALRVVVEPSNVDLLFEEYSVGNQSEVAIVEGQRVTVVGSVLRSGGERPTADASFREAGTSIILVAGSERPIVITASVSDSDAR